MIMKIEQSCPEKKMNEPQVLKELDKLCYSGNCDERKMYNSVMDVINKIYQLECENSELRKKQSEHNVEIASLKRELESEIVRLNRENTGLRKAIANRCGDHLEETECWANGMKVEVIMNSIRGEKTFIEGKYIMDENISTLELRQKGCNCSNCFFHEGNHCFCEARSDVRNGEDHSFYYKYCGTLRYEDKQMRVSTRDDFTLPYDICEFWLLKRGLGVFFKDGCFAISSGRRAKKFQTFFEAISYKYNKLKEDSEKTHSILRNAFIKKANELADEREFVRFISEIYGQDVMKQIKKDFKKYKEEQQK